MLPLNYDAKAVASVMGLGFLSDPKADIARDDHFSIRVDGAILLMSEVVDFSDISGTSDGDSRNDRERRRKGPAPLCPASL